jgi:molybdopterin-synthase adenylyltransferase
MAWSPEERYSRQVLFPGIGPEGQRRLGASSVAIVGCGATGSVLAMLLARSGVGGLRLIDRDYVEPSNLQRQILFDEHDAAESVPKAVAAARHLARINSDIALEPQVADLTPSNIAELLEGAHVILDGADNFETRYLLNDYAVLHGRPWIYAGAVGSQAATMNILPGRTACLTCIFPEPPRGDLETCDTAGILNPAASLAASLAAGEALKLLAGADDKLRSTLLSFDLWTGQRAEVNAQQPRSGCPTCQLRQFPHLAGKARAAITLCGRNSVQIHERRRQMDFADLSRRLESHGQVRHNSFVLKFWHDGYELTLFPDGRAIIKGTTDTAVARSLYARYVGV